MRLMILISLVCLLCGCATQHYRETQKSDFSGVLNVRWIENDYFLFLPDKEEPFSLVRANGDVIKPGPMYTDGGSIPRFLWGIEGYSPWGYAPAYIVHDWLFEAKHCGHEPDNQYTFEDSVAVMAEALKAVMQADPEVRNYFVFDTVVASVGSPIARRIWEKGSCQPPILDKRTFSTEALPGDLLMTIRFD
jgi:hypothetical protein